MARDTKAEYQARKLRAQAEGYSGYGQKRGRENREIERLMNSTFKTGDIVFGSLPAEKRTRANAIRYRKSFYYLGTSTPQTLKTRRQFVKDMEGDIDLGVWGDYYKDVIYPMLTGKQFPGWVPMQLGTQPVTPDEWDDMVRNVTGEELDE